MTLKISMALKISTRGIDMHLSIKESLESVVDTIKKYKDVQFTAGISLSYLGLEIFDKVRDAGIIRTIESPPYYADKWAHLSYGYCLSKIGDVFYKSLSTTGPILEDASEEDSEEDKLEGCSELEDLSKLEYHYKLESREHHNYKSSLFSLALVLGLSAAKEMFDVFIMGWPADARDSLSAVAGYLTYEGVKHFHYIGAFLKSLTNKKLRSEN